MVKLTSNKVNLFRIVVGTGNVFVGKTKSMVFQILIKQLLESDDGSSLLTVVFIFAIIVFTITEQCVFSLEEEHVLAKQTVLFSPPLARGGARVSKKEKQTGLNSQRGGFYIKQSPGYSVICT